MLAEKLESEPLKAPDALVIYTNQTQDHDIFGLDYSGQAWLQQRFPDVRVSPKLSLTRDDRRVLEFQLDDFKGQVVTLLAGVSLERLRATGLREVHFIDGRSMKHAATLVMS